LFSDIKGRTIEDNYTY